MQRGLNHYWTATGAACLIAAPAGAVIIDDASFFDDIPHTFVDFETRDDGSPLNLEPGELAFAPGDEFFKLGFVASGMNVAYAYDGGKDAQAALAIGGTPTIDLFMFNAGGVLPGFTFIEDQRSVGFYVVMNISIGIDPPRITAFTRDGQIVESSMFIGGVVDGSVGVIDYGYFGLSSDVGFASIKSDSVHGFAIDDFRFSSVPAPGSFFLGALGVALAGRRRCQVCY